MHLYISKILWKYGSGLVGAGVFIGFYLPFVKDTMCYEGASGYGKHAFYLFWYTFKFCDGWFILGVALKVYSHTHDILYSRPKRFVQCKL